MGAVKLAKNTQNAPKFICPNCLPKPNSLEFWWKKASLGICSLCSRQNSQDQRTSFLADTGKKNFHLLFLLSCSYRKSFFTANALTLPVRCLFFKRAIKILLACFTCGGWSTKLPIATKVYRKTKDTFLLKAKREVICVLGPHLLNGKEESSYDVQNPKSSRQKKIVHPAFRILCTINAFLFI